jgi:hypothetical protein
MTSDQLFKHLLALEVVRDSFYANGLVESSAKVDSLLAELVSSVLVDDELYDEFQSAPRTVGAESFRSRLMKELSCMSE